MNGHPHQPVITYLDRPGPSTRSADRPARPLVVKRGRKRHVWYAVCRFCQSAVFNNQVSYGIGGYLTQQQAYAAAIAHWTSCPQTFPADPPGPTRETS